MKEKDFSDQERSIATGDEGFQTDRWEEASKIFRRILAEDPGCILAFAEKAQTLRAQGRVEEAEELVAAGITIDPEYPPLLVQRGHNQWTREDWKGALETWEKVLKQQPDCLDAFVGRATALSEIGDSDRALECLEAGLHAHPHSEWLLGLHGQFLLDLKRWDEALEHLEAALQKHPRNEWLLGLRGQLLLNLKRWDDALEHLEAALRAHPRSEWLLALRGQLLLNLKRWDDALEHLEAALRAHPRSEWLLALRGQLLLNLKRWDEALEHLEAALQLHPRNEWLLGLRGQLLLDLKRSDDALGHLEKALQVHPRSEQLLALFGQLLLNMQKWDQALEHLEAALHAHPRDEWLLGLLLECCTGRVKALRKMRHFDEAMKAVSHALGRFPENVPLRIARAELSSLSRDWESTVRDWQAVIDLKPDDDRAHWEMAEALRKLKRDKEADAVMAEWLERHPDYPSIAPNSMPSKGFSQLGQDLWILQQTNHKTGGYFVEFGACDGVFLSNTYLLETSFDWAGICAEPNRELFHRLTKNRNCLCLQECVFSESGKTLPFFAAGELGTLQEFVASDSHEATRAQAQAESYTVSTISLNDLLEKALAPATIDYISVDTEGSEYEILRTFDFERWNVRCWTIEHNYTESRDKIAELMTSHGYRRIAQDWDDWFYLPVEEIRASQRSDSPHLKKETGDFDEGQVSLSPVHGDASAMIDCFVLSCSLVPCLHTQCTDIWYRDTCTPSGLYHHSTRLVRSDVINYELIINRAFASVLSFHLSQIQSIDR